MPGLIKEGRVWISEPPLYRAKSSGSINYLKDDQALENFKKENKNKKFDISCGSKSIRPLVLKVEGKQACIVEDFLLGNKVNAGDFIE